MDIVPELVVIAEQLLAPVPGGTGRYTAELLRALAETVPDGWTLSSVVARHSDIESARIAGVAGPRRLPVPPRLLPIAWQAGVPWWPGGTAVHAPTPLAPPSARPARRLSVTVHDTVPWTHPETLTPRGVRWHRTMITRAARRAHALVVPTATVAAELATHASIPTPVDVIPHGVPELAAPAPMRLPERYVLAVGTVEPRKGIDVLIEAMALLEQPALPLLLVGQPGWGELDPLRLAREQGLPEGRVRVLGRVSDAELATVLQGASVVTIPSLAEGFGLPVLEAMAAGVPVVHSDAAALVEVAGGAGRTVPRADPRSLAQALQEVLGCRELSARLVTAGRARAAEFSWYRSARRVWALHAGPEQDGDADRPAYRCSS